MLLYQSIFGHRKDIYKILFSKALQFYPYRETSLKFRYQIGRFCSMESTCADEQDMVRLYGTVFSIDDAALYYRKNISLDSFS